MPVALRNIQLGLLSLIVGLASVYLLDSDAVATGGFFQGYTWLTCFVVAQVSLGGLLVSLVMKCAPENSPAPAPPRPLPRSKAMASQPTVARAAPFAAAAAASRLGAGDRIDHPLAHYDLRGCLPAAGTLTTS